MEPEEIEGREFLMGLRGYDRNEVDEFLTAIAGELRQARAERDALRDAPPAADPYEQLGFDVSTILRTAHEEADACRAQADADADASRAAADEYAARVRREIAADAEQARDALEGARREATRIVDEARAEAEVRRQEATADATRIIAEAEGRAAIIVSDAEARVPAIEDEAARAGRARASVQVEDLEARAREATRLQEAARARLLEASDEVQLALIAIGEAGGDPAATVRHAVLDLVAIEEHAPTD
jgi:DivIVA domain-containing protein